MSAFGMNARVKNLLFLVREGQYKVISRKILFRLYSQTNSYCLRRDLQVPFEPQPSQIPLVVRPLYEEDIDKIFGSLNEEDPDSDELALRLEHVHADIPTCYVAVTNENTPAYMQWLMGHCQNKQIAAYFNGVFPALAADEALLENALTLHAFRGKGIMPWAMARIAEHGAEIGARWVMTFVEEHNIASLKGCKRAGFLPYLMRSERWFLFHRSLRFTPVPERTLYSLDTVSNKPPSRPIPTLV